MKIMVRHKSTSNNQETMATILIYKQTLQENIIYIHSTLKLFVCVILQEVSAFTFWMFCILKNARGTLRFLQLLLTFQFPFSRTMPRSL